MLRCNISRRKHDILSYVPCPTIFFSDTFCIKKKIPILLLHFYIFSQETSFYHSIAYPQNKIKIIYPCAFFYHSIPKEISIDAANFVIDSNSPDTYC